uniref:Uncharacterized protein n=1 Tax=Caenorhabditis japonica TaxID=281687 RepID=A0A8R1IF83_CAEJA
MPVENKNMYVAFVVKAQHAPINFFRIALKLELSSTHSIPRFFFFFFTALIDDYLDISDGFAEFFRIRPSVRPRLSRLRIGYGNLNFFLSFLFADAKYFAFYSLRVFLARFAPKSLQIQLARKVFQRGRKFNLSLTCFLYCFF